MDNDLNQPCQPESKTAVWKRLGEVLADAHVAGITLEEFLAAVAEAAPTVFAAPLHLTYATDADD
jgi:hypothetical protein